MQQRHLVGAMAIALATLTIGYASSTTGAPAKDTDRVLIKYKKGNKAQLKQVLKEAGARFHYSFDNMDTMAVTVPVAALEGLKHRADVESIEVDAPRYPMGQTMPWGIPRVQAPEAVAAGADGSGIKVCIIDSGINPAHEEFAGMAITGDSGNGQPWNVDNCGHGTHVAGTIAAADNGTGVVGVSPGKVALHIVKVFGDSTPGSCGWSYASTLIDAAQRCQAAGAKVINMSLGGTGSSIAERDAFTRLYQQGVLSIAAAGNDGNGAYSYPASYDSVVAVAALDSNNKRAAFSQFTSQVELAAPGVDILSSVPFRSAAVRVGDNDYPATAMVGTVQAVAQGALVSGGLCTTTGIDWNGKVVLCKRGSNSFADKATRVTAAGGLGMIVYNDIPGGFTGSLTPYVSTIPAVSVTNADGEALLAGQLGQQARVDTVAMSPASGYGYMSGTSMATPHVTGVAALAWSAAPQKSNQQVREALSVTAIDLDAPGRDINTGWGLVQAKAAANELVNGGLPQPGSTPGQLMVVGNTVKNKYQVDLLWTRGNSTVDVYRGGTKIMSAIPNTLAATDAPKLRGSGTLIYQVCNAGTSQCSAKASLYY
ncbi:S8 family serine peptidase [Lysobacter solisilvae (ex Woo and Kim 2022)]|uniref:S8 family serine peptidase n=1 Tax=Agrilutibacter terrestris TaxID=2865112 RepID=A0A7H0FWJ3_9GAMM|nr:S8 family serine peptidase [Lysobacter terrestris]QNP40409.1 S8 family serine peptidase [Lysobacter terrestris]